MDYTKEHHNHIKEKGFNPAICPECQEIDAILNKVVARSDASEDLYEALKELRHRFQVAGEVLGLTESHISNILSPSDKALAKADKGE